jgi:predicted RNase H-like HicB family nuclease
MEIVVTAVYEPVPESEGGGYTAYAEELPGAISEGDTLEEARRNLQDAIAILREANRELTATAGSTEKVTREKITVSVT